MIDYKSFALDNGLKVIFHRDPSTPMAAINLIYKVGSRDENPEKTGFAHLFEHLMFEGSVNIENFDEELEKAGGNNNAFTSNDYTDYYITIPKDNIETALWLESDRMLSLDFSEEKLEIQKNVVIEEFKEVILNQPYGDVMKLLRKLTYKVHPYRWCVIGENFEHIEKATLDDVKEFFFKFYAPNNAILSIGGNFDFHEIKSLVEKWFGDIPRRNVPVRDYPEEPEQTERRFMEVERDVPLNAIYMSFPYFSRLEFGYYVSDFITDILAEGDSSRLYRNLVKEKEIFSETDAMISGSIDKGMLVIFGILNEGITMEQAEEAIWEELEKLKEKPISDYELQKIRNNSESELIFSRVNLMRRVMNLGYYEMLADAKLYNEEGQKYLEITKEDIMAYSKIIFSPHKANVLYYKAKPKP